MLSSAPSRPRELQAWQGLRQATSYWQLTPIRCEDCQPLRSCNSCVGHQCLLWSCTCGLREWLRQWPQTTEVGALGVDLREDVVQSHGGCHEQTPAIGIEQDAMGSFTGHDHPIMNENTSRVVDVSYVGGPGRARSWKRACIPYRYRTPLHFNHTLLLTYPSPFPSALRTMVAEVICVKSEYVRAMCSFPPAITACLRLLASFKLAPPAKNTSPC